MTGTSDGIQLYHPVAVTAVRRPLVLGNGPRLLHIERSSRGNSLCQLYLLTFYGS